MGTQPEIVSAEECRAARLDLLGTYHWLDLTALGRQEDGPGMDWLRRHDEYEPGQVSNL